MSCSPKGDCGIGLRSKYAKVQRRNRRHSIINIHVNNKLRIYTTVLAANTTSNPKLFQKNYTTLRLRLLAELLPLHWRLSGVPHCMGRSGGNSIWLFLPCEQRSTRDGESHTPLPSLAPNNRKANIFDTYSNAKSISCQSRTGGDSLYLWPPRLIFDFAEYCKMVFQMKLWTLSKQTGFS